MPVLSQGAHLDAVGAPLAGHRQVGAGALNHLVGHHVILEGIGPNNVVILFVLISPDQAAALVMGAADGFPTRLQRHVGAPNRVHDRQVEVFVWIGGLHLGEHPAFPGLNYLPPRLAFPKMVLGPARRERSRAVALEVEAPRARRAWGWGGGAGFRRFCEEPAAAQPVRRPLGPGGDGRRGPAQTVTVASMIIDVQLPRHAGAAQCQTVIQHIFHAHGVILRHDHEGGGNI